MITRFKNPLVKQVRGLKERKHREESRLFTIEGKKELQLAIQGGVVIETVLYTADVQGHTPDTILDLQGKLNDPMVRYEAVSLEVFARLVYRDVAGGVLGVARIPEKDILELVLPPEPLILAACGLEKPGNLGAILRSADGAGVDAVLFCDAKERRSPDLYNPNVVRGSLGAIFTVPVFILTSEAAFALLAEHHIPIVAATPSASTLHTDISFIGTTCIALGSESAGLPDTWLEKADQQVRIPLKGKMDSLNVSCSAAILLYEALRQRQ